MAAIGLIKSIAPQRKTRMPEFIFQLRQINLFEPNLANTTVSTDSHRFMPVYGTIA